MPLSYKIIKNSNISCDKEDISVIDTKIDYSIQESFLKLDIYEDDSKDIINIDKIREQIRRDLYLEYEQERLEIIAMAKNEAENISLLAKQQGQKDGLMKGYEEGYRRGIEAANAEGVSLKNNAISLIEQAQKQVSIYFTESHDNIIKLAGVMAESIVQSTIDVSDENIIMLIKPVIQQFNKKESIIITCHPDSIAYINCYLYELENSCPNAKFIILQDGNLEKNGCVVENENEIIDLQIKKQIDSIIKSIEDIKSLE